MFGFEQAPGSGDRLYGVDIYDTGSAPVIMHAGFAPINTGTSIGTAEFDGQYMYTLGDGLTIYDVSDPIAPVLLSEGATSHSVLAVDGDRAFVGRRTFDITDRANPVLEYYYPPYVYPDGWPVGAVLDGDFIYSINDAGLSILNIAGCGMRCAADLNMDGQTNFFDVSLFLQLYMAQDPAADLNTDGNIDFNDVSTFINVFMTDCG